MPEEQIWCRMLSPVAVLTFGLMRTRVNYGIFHTAPSQLPWTANCSSTRAWILRESTRKRLSAWWDVCIAVRSAV
jgi:hypothetical protein